MSNISIFKTKLISLQGNLANFAYKLTSNRDAALDLVQETTLKVLDNEHKYVDNVNFKGWVFTIMRNIFINNYRRKTRAATVIDSTEDLYHLNLSQTSGMETPEGSFSAKEIAAAINSFTPEYKEPFTMYIARLQIQRDRRQALIASRNSEEPHILCPQTPAEGARRLPICRLTDKWLLIKAD